MEKAETVEKLLGIFALIKAPWFKNFRARLKNLAIGPTRYVHVVLAGPSGVGKSHVFELLKKGVPLIETVSDHHPTGRPRAHKLEGEVFGRLVDLPGQASFLQGVPLPVSGRQRKLTLLYVVAYGFHSRFDKLSYKESIDQPFTADLLENYLKKCRVEEGEHLGEVILWIRNQGYDIERILIIANKADLWKDKESDVLSYYNHGGEGDLIFKRKIGDALGNAVSIPVLFTATAAGHSNMHVSSGDPRLGTIEVCKGVDSEYLTKMRRALIKAVNDSLTSSDLVRVFGETVE